MFARVRTQSYGLIRNIVLDDDIQSNILLCKQLFCFYIPELVLTFPKMMFLTAGQSLTFPHIITIALMFS